MHITVKIYIATLFILLSASVKAGPADTSAYSHQLVRSAGIAFPVLNYSLFSRLNHSGFALAFHSNRFREKQKYLSQFHLHFEPGLLYNSVNDSYIASLTFRSNWSRHWHVTDRFRAFRFLCGFSADTGVDIYMKENHTNNPMAYFFYLSAGASIMGKYRFNIGKSFFDLGQQIDIPVGSLVSSSGYSSSLPYPIVEDDANFFDAMYLVSFGNLKKISGTTNLDIAFPGEKNRKWPTLRISYMFSGKNYHMNDFSIKSVDHIILFGTIFRLFR